jgi:hypothetical protein
MKLLGISATAWMLALASTFAQGHGTAETPVAPANLTGETVVHRLTQLGYSDVRIVRQSDDSADVELGRAGQRYALTVSKKLTGPGTLTNVDVAEVVQRGLRPVGSPNVPVVPANPTVPR